MPSPVSFDLARYCAIAAVVVLLSGCTDDPEVDAPDAGAEDTEVGEDVADERDVDDADAEQDASEEPTERVEIDLPSYIDDVDTEGTVSVYQSTDESQLIDGASAESQTGDYILENDRVRFAVQDDERIMTPCPWGGNIIDAEYRDDGYGGDILGGHCLFLNADQTLRPHTYEILRDGSNGVAVLAVTGTTAILDYLNLEWMFYNLLGPSLADLFELKPDGLLPLTITQYYILGAGEPGVQVVTGMRNDGDDELSLVVSQLMVNGADGSYYNPLGQYGGFGYENLGVGNLDPDRIPFLALSAPQSSLAYMPAPHERFDGEEALPIAGSYLTLFNVAAAILGRTDAMSTLLASEEELEQMEGAYHLSPDEVDVIEHRLFVGDGDLSSVIDPIYDLYDRSMTDLSGRVVDADGQPVAGATVSAVDGERRTMNQALTDGEGDYSMTVPHGTYELLARSDEQYTVDPPVVPTGTDDAMEIDDLVTTPTGIVEVSVRTPSEDPTPARVSVICDGECPHRPTSNERDMAFDGLPQNFATVEWVGVSGDLSFPLPEGSYEVVISRGMEWSLWPSNAHLDGGAALEVTSGESTSVDAEIAPVIDTSGAMSGDFHVHTISSLDSTTPHRDRILAFLAEGVDVVVSSDHDVIVDYAPAVEALGAEEEVVTMVGSEITTIDTGHFNAFPLEQNENLRQGGSLDWARGEQMAMTPSDIFDWIREHPDEQVVQVNHPDVSFMTFSDVLRGITYGDESVMRVDMPDYDPETGDTGLWSDEFTAMELMNGPDLDRFWGVTRWWLTMIGRGHTPTGTAVTDTHVRYGRMMGGVPRTYVFVDEDNDRPATFDDTHFVESVNAGRAVGTSGPFIRVEATNHSGESAGIGDILATDDEAVTFSVTVEAPEWVDVDRMEMIINSEEVVTEPGEFDTSPIEPTETFDVEFDEEDLEVVESGDSDHRRYQTTLEVDVETEEDAYVVFLFHGNEEMAPVLPPGEEPALAFTNPIFLDADGQGYSNPPLAELAATDPGDIDPQAMLESPRDQKLKPMDRHQRLEFFFEHHHQFGGICEH